MPPRRRKEEPLKFSDLLRAAGEELTVQARRPDLHGYVPHDKQVIFHENKAYGRAFLGGNRSGKTVAGVVEDIWWLTKTHPYRDIAGLYPEPIRGRVVGVDFTRGIDQIIIPEYKRWLPKQYLINNSWDDSYSISDRVLTLNNGSTVEFMSYEQDTDKFAGTSRHFVHFDEEPPEHIWEECMLRLLDTDGSWWLTMTPIEGMTWIYDDIFLPAEEEGVTDPFVVTVNNAENPYLNEDARERVLGSLKNKDKRAVRESGQFIEIGGRVYKDFAVETHVIPAMVPNKTWQWFMSLDSGWNNPTAVLWHAVSPDNIIITFGEHYASEMTVAEHAAVIKARESAWDREADLRTGDPAMRQTKEQTGTSVQQEYALNGIFLALDGVPTGPGSVQIGVMRMQQYMRIDPILNKPRWYVTEDCVNLIRELKRLHWKVPANKKLAATTNPQEAIHKMDDHAADALRYFITLMPDLTPDDIQFAKQEIAPGGGFMRYDEMLVKMHKVHEAGEIQFAEENNIDSTPWNVVSEFDLH